MCFMGMLVLGSLRHWRAAGHGYDSVFSSGSVKLPHAVMAVSCSKGAFLVTS